MIGMTFSLIVVQIYYLFQDDLIVLEIIAKIVHVQLLIQAIVFAIISYFILARLRGYFPGFYKDYRCTLLIVVIGFTLSLSMRSIFNLFLWHFDRSTYYVFDLKDHIEVIVSYFLNFFSNCF